jgi:hypothetical protein
VIRCHSSAREGGDGRFYVTVRNTDDLGFNPFTESPFDPRSIDRAAERKAFVNVWIEANCAHEASIFGGSSVCFDDESDAVLFWLTFKTST